MTDVATNRTSATCSLPPPTYSTHQPVSLHAMSTRSSEAMARRQLNQQHQHYPAPPSSTSGPHQHPEPHGLPSGEGRLTRKRAQSINIEETNHHRADELSLQSPGLLSTSSSTSTVSTADLICICPSPPKVPRPRNAFILYRQHHQAGVVLKYPGLANPDISKIIGEHWREETEETKNYWKRLAEEEKARHQRQYPQYKYQPRRGGKGGPASRPTSGTGEGGDPGRCPKCGGRYIATPRTPSTPFGSVSSQGGQQGPGPGPTSSGPSAVMQPFITNNPRVIETVQPHHGHRRQSIESQYSGEPRRSSIYGYPHASESLRSIDEDYDGMQVPMSRRRGPQAEDYEMLASPELKRRRFGGVGGPLDQSPEHGIPMSVIPPHHQHHNHPLMSSSSSAGPYSQHPDSRRSSVISNGGPVYSSQPGGNNGNGGSSQSHFSMAPLPHPRLALGPNGPQRGDMGEMAPPPRPSRLSTSGGSVPAPPASGPVPPPPPPAVSAAAAVGTGLAPAGGSSFDESLTLAPLKIPNSPTQTSSETSGCSSSGGGGRSLSGGGPSGLGIMTGGYHSGMQQQQQYQHQNQQQFQLQRGGSGGGDSQARGIEAMVMSIPYLNKLDVLRKISPPLGPPAPGSPMVETRGPVIAIEGTNPALLKEVRPIIERALRGSGECEVRMWMDSAVENAMSGLSTPPGHEGGIVGGERGGVGLGATVIIGGRKGGEDIDHHLLGESQDNKTSLIMGGGDRHNNKSSSSRSGSRSGGSNTPIPLVVPPPRRGNHDDNNNNNKNSSHSPSSPTGMFQYLQTIMGWHAKSADIIKHITTRPSPYSPATSTDNNSSNNNNYSGSGGGGGGSSSSLVPVALIPGGFSLTLSDKFASTVAITDPYSPVDHWQWMATLWRGIVGADLVVYVVREYSSMTGGGGGGDDDVSSSSSSSTHNKNNTNTTGGGTVEYRAPGVMVVRVVGDKIDEKTERRLAFEVMEWVRAGSFRDGYAFGSGEVN